MEEPIKIQVRDSRFFLAVCVLCSIVFGFFLIAFTVTGIKKQDMEALKLCIPIFGGLLLLCAGLSISILRRTLTLYDSYFSYTPSFGRTGTFSYTEIKALVEKRERFILYGYDGAKLAIFENNMPAFAEAVNFLIEKHVYFVPWNP